MSDTGVLFAGAAKISNRSAALDDKELVTLGTLCYDGPMTTGRAAIAVRRALACVENVGESLADPKAVAHYAVALAKRISPVRHQSTALRAEHQQVVFAFPSLASRAGGER